MKELYVSPELELIRLAAEERLANNEFELDDLTGGGTSGNGNAAVESVSDIDIPLY